MTCVGKMNRIHCHLKLIGVKVFFKSLLMLVGPQRVDFISKKGCVQRII